MIIDVKISSEIFRNIDVNKNFADNTLDHDGMVMVVFIAQLLTVAVDYDIGLESKPWTMDMLSNEIIGDNDDDGNICLDCSPHQVHIYLQACHKLNSPS